VLLAAAPARAAVITGSVIGAGATPIAGATVEVLEAQPPCTSVTGPDGNFSLTCAATGRRSMRATWGALVPWQLDDLDFAPDHSLHLNFMLLPRQAPAVAVPSGTVGWWEAPLPNPALGTWLGRTITLRALGIAMAIAGFVLGAGLIVLVSRRLRVEKRRLSADEAADLVMNARRPLGQRVMPVAVGAVGAQVSLSYGAEELAAAIEARRWGVLAASLVAPLLVSAAVVGFALAILVGQPLYLFVGMLVMAAGFVVTPVIIVVQALSAVRKQRSP
jgi:hypothetical protein